MVEVTSIMSNSNGRMLFAHRSDAPRVTGDTPARQ